MISTFPHDRFRGLPEFLLAITVILIALLFTSGRIQSAFHHLARTEVATDFQSASQHLVSQIESATKNQELEILRAIDRKYSSNPDETPVSNARAQVTARRVELELMVSKQLDVTRHRQEVSLRTDPTRPQPPGETTKGNQRLSVLPR